jgi:uncharacterized protein YbjT (DUF2867 family)
MNVVIFGSTGPTGQHLIRQALSSGHHVTAFARTPNKVTVTHERLRVHKGDVGDPASVDAAIKGQDAVVSALGSGVWSKERVRERGTQGILRAMDNHGVSRLVVLSSFGVGDTHAELPFFLRYFLVPLYLARAFRDCAAMEKHLSASDHQWVVARPPFLTNDPGVGSVQTLTPQTMSSLAMKVSREDVAQFMLEQLSSDAWVHKHAPISN